MKQFFLFLVALCCAGMLSAAQFDGLRSIESGGQTRQYYLYVPDGLKANSPLMISCHENSQGYIVHKNQTEWCSMADTAGFVVVYPLGTSGSAYGMSYSSGWDWEGMTDINFMSDIIDAVKADYSIDESRVYLSGFGFGAAFVYHAIHEAADKFAAYAPVSGYDPTENQYEPNTNSSRPVPIIHIHGTQDENFPPTNLIEYSKQWGRKLCNDKSPGDISGDGWMGRRSDPTSCNCEVELAFYLISKRWHVWTNEGFHTSDSIWNFCKQFSTACGREAEGYLTLSVSAISDEEPATVVLTAEPHLPNGVSVHKVVFSWGNTKKTVTTAPYQVTADNLVKGKHTFTATLTDSKGKEYIAKQSFEVKENTSGGGSSYSGMKSITSGGKSRQYYLYVPAMTKPKRPMMISCHGMDQTYQYQMDQTRWNAIADTTGLIVVYPVGVAGSAWGMNYTTGWDVEGMSDINFMMDIIEDIASIYPIDRTRIYLSGFSLGGAFVYHAINELANKFAAYAPVSGYNLVTTNTFSSRPVPIVHVHGDADNTMGYNGVEGYIKAWAQAQNCNMTPIETQPTPSYKCTRYRDGDCETEVVLYTVIGRGHVPSDNHFPTSHYIWNFCKHYDTGCGKINPEGIEEITNDQSPMTNKVIRDGHIFILRGDKTYTLQGQEVR